MRFNQPSRAVFARAIPELSDDDDITVTEIVNTYGTYLETNHYHNTARSVRRAYRNSGLSSSWAKPNWDNVAQYINATYLDEIATHIWYNLHSTHERLELAQEIGLVREYDNYRPDHRPRVYRIWGLLADWMVSTGRAPGSMIGNITLTGAQVCRALVAYLAHEATRLVDTLEETI